LSVYIITFSGNFSSTSYKNEAFEPCAFSAFPRKGTARAFSTITTSSRKFVERFQVMRDVNPDVAFEDGFIQPPLSAKSAAVTSAMVAIWFILCASTPPHESKPVANELQKNAAPLVEAPR